MIIRIADGKMNFFHLAAFFCPALLRNMIGVACNSRIPQENLHAALDFVHAQQCCGSDSDSASGSRIPDPQDFMILGLPYPHPDLLVASTDTAPDPSILNQKQKKTLFLCLRLDFFAVLRIRIRMFWGLPDPHPDPLYRGTDPRKQRIVPGSH